MITPAVPLTMRAQMQVGGGWRDGVCVLWRRGGNGVIITPPCWCGTYRDSDCNGHSREER